MLSRQGQSKIRPGCFCSHSALNLVVTICSTCRRRLIAPTHSLVYPSPAPLTHENFQINWWTNVMPWEKKINHWLSNIWQQESRGNRCHLRVSTQRTGSAENCSEMPWEERWAPGRKDPWNVQMSAEATPPPPCFSLCSSMLSFAGNLHFLLLKRGQTFLYPGHCACQASALSVTYSPGVLFTFDNFIGLRQKPALGLLRSHKTKGKHTPK